MPHPSVRPAWSHQLLERLDAGEVRARSLAGSLTVAQLNWRADSTSWSVGQCLDHLRISNEVYAPPIERSLQSTAARGAVDEIRPGWFGRYFIRTVIEPSPKTRKGKAPGKITPVAEVDATVLDRFIRSNDRIRALIKTAEPYDVNRVRFVNPFIGIIRFTVGTGFEVITRHQDRHLLQAERVRANPRFPA